MKSTNLSGKISDFFWDKEKLTEYVTSRNQGENTQDNLMEELLRLEKKWNRYPLLYRCIKDDLQKLKALTPKGKVSSVEDFSPAESTRYMTSEKSLAAPLLYFPVPEKQGSFFPNIPLNTPKKKAGEKISWQQTPTLSSKHAEAELKHIHESEAKFDRALETILEKELPETINFSRSMNIKILADYFFTMFGKELYFDSLLSITQQYALADVPMVNESKSSIGKTGFHLSFFGNPGTGKTFAINDLILGNEKYGIKAHGLIGRNRYCGSMTPAKFVRMAEAYHDKKFNFIIPEFDDWFRYKGMINTLKLAMEGGIVEYETNNETIGPYTFSSFLSVNYNARLTQNDYESTISDPHFRAIEDRMLNNLHRMTPSRYQALSESKEKLERGILSMDLAGMIQRNLMLVYAIETEHPLVKDTFSSKKVLVPSIFYEELGKAREGILYFLNGSDATKESGIVDFSPRLERKVLQLACAMSLPAYFSPEVINLETVPVSSSAIEYAIRFFVQEASIRSTQKIDAAYILRELGIKDKPRE